MRCTALQAKKTFSQSAACPVPITHIKNYKNCKIRTLSCSPDRTIHLIALKNCPVSRKINKIRDFLLTEYPPPPVNSAGQAFASLFHEKYGILMLEQNSHRSRKNNVIGLKSSLRGRIAGSELRNFSSNH